jgi:pterin-4a-carbinolamine dehydratase/very-short-patch-repair endonuclease
MTVETYLRTQAGLISRAQALAAGLSRGAVDHRVTTRRWQPVHPRVYLATGYDLDSEARVRAAVLWAGRDAVLTGLAAAWWHGLADDAPATVAVAVPRRRRPSPRQGAAVHRREFTERDVVVVRGIAVTAPALAALDAAVELGAAGVAFLDRAIARGVGRDAVRAAYPRAAGPATARTLLSALADRMATAGRRRLVAALRAARVGGWRRGFDLAGHVVELGFPRARVAVEVDGWGGDDPERAGRDERRRAALAALGWTVLRFGDEDVHARPGAVVAQIVGAVAAEPGDRRAVLPTSARAPGRPTRAAATPDSPPAAARQRGGPTDTRRPQLLADTPAAPGLCRAARAVTRSACGVRTRDDGLMPDLLDDAAIASALDELPGWARDGDALVRTAKLPDFPTAIGVVDRVAEIAEERGHHPDIDIRWRTLTFRLSTHSEGGITELDVALAGAISEQVSAAGG